MKKIILLLLAIIIPLGAGAQKRMTFDQLQKKYSDRQGYTTIEITEAMLKMIGLKDISINSMDMLAGMKGISSIKIVMSDEQNAEFTRDMKNAASEENGYKLLTSVREKGQSVTLYFKEAPKQQKEKNNAARISEIMIIVSGESDNMLLNILGDFSIKQISSAVSRTD